MKKCIRVAFNKKKKTNNKQTKKNKKNTERSQTIVCITSTMIKYDLFILLIV